MEIVKKLLRDNPEISMDRESVKKTESTWKILDGSRSCWGFCRDLKKKAR